MDVSAWLFAEGLESLALFDSHSGDFRVKKDSQKGLGRRSVAKRSTQVPESGLFSKCLTLLQRRFATHDERASSILARPNTNEC